MAVPKYIVVACVTTPATQQTPEKSRFLEARPADDSKTAASFAQDMLATHRASQISSYDFGPGASFIDVQVYTSPLFDPDLDEKK